MKLQFCSDLHQDNYSKILDIPVLAPNLALIGDIGGAFHPSTYQFLDNISHEFERVFYIPGNHEYYCHSIAETDARLEELCSDLDIELLQKKTVQVDDVLISGCTLWSDATEEGFHKTNDKRWIKGFSRQEMVSLHKDHLSFLQEEQTKNKTKPHVFLTHYAPLFDMNGSFQGGLNNCMFATDLEYMFQPPLTHWLCGHVHQNLTVFKNNIPCISNCFGDPHEIDIHESFELGKYIEVL